MDWQAAYTEPAGLRGGQTFKVIRVHWKHARASTTNWGSFGLLKHQLLDTKQNTLCTPDAGAGTSVLFNRVCLPHGLTSTDEMFPVEAPDSEIHRTLQSHEPLTTPTLGCLQADPSSCQSKCGSLLLPLFCFGLGFFFSADSENRLIRDLRAASD